MSGGVVGPEWPSDEDAGDKRTSTTLVPAIPEGILTIFPPLLPVLRPPMRASLAFPFVLMFACTDSTGPYTSGCRETTVEIAISAGLTPTFEWTPDCRVYSLLVTRPYEDPEYPAEYGESMWQTFTFNRNEISAPVVYGVHSHDGEILDSKEPAIPLESGVTYAVTLFVVGTGFSPQLVAGQKSFTP